MVGTCLGSYIRLTLSCWYYIVIITEASLCFFPLGSSCRSPSACEKPFLPPRLFLCSNKKKTKTKTEHIIGRVTIKSPCVNGSLRLNVHYSSSGTGRGDWRGGSAERERETVCILNQCHLAERPTDVLLVPDSRQWRLAGFPSRPPRLHPLPAAATSLGFDGGQNSFHRVLIWRAISLQVGIVARAKRRLALLHFNFTLGQSHNWAY